MKKETIIKINYFLIRNLNKFLLLIIPCINLIFFKINNLYCEDPPNIPTLPIEEISENNN